MKYESYITYHLKVIANVKGFADKGTNGRTDKRTSGPTYGHILAQLSKPLLGLLVGYFSNILGYKKSVFTFRFRQV